MPTDFFRNWVSSLSEAIGSGLESVSNSIFKFARQIPDGAEELWDNFFEDADSESGHSEYPLNPQEWVENDESFNGFKVLQGFLEDVDESVDDVAKFGRQIPNVVQELWDNVASIWDDFFVEESDCVIDCRIAVDRTSPNDKWIIGSACESGRIRLDFSTAVFQDQEQGSISTIRII